MPMDVVKASGEKVPFSKKKVENSMERAKIPRDLRKKALSYLETVIYPEIPTGEIYKLIYDYLRSISRHHAAKYSLRAALMALGPSGYPFEKFVAKLFEAKGFTARTNIIIQGACIEHEVDVVAEKENEKIMVECKFHHELGMKTDSQVALYVYARFLDIAQNNGFTKPWIVTNTKITQNVRRYSECNGINILSWEYPILKNLPSLIEENNLHPITALTTLSRREKEVLLKEGFVLCSDFTKLDSSITKRLSLNPERLKQAQREAQLLLS